jgi:hypothetical protein
MLMSFFAALAAGAASAFYLAYNYYHRLLLNGVIHSGILISMLVICILSKKLNMRTAGLYQAGAPPCSSCDTFYNNKRPCSVDGCKPHLAEFLVLAMNHCVEQQL